MGNKIIKDSVHGYIEVLPNFSKIIDTEEFQRLKWIEQGSFRVLYPAARHDRFIHSLGTYYLATKIAPNFIANIKEDLNIQIDNEQEELICNTFYYASLLHDIGHAPFSHTTECFFKSKLRNGNVKINGEEISEKLIDEIYNINANNIERFIKEFKGIKPAAHEIISATILVQKANDFLGHNCNRLVDLELAARMVIGCTYDYNGEKELGLSEKNLLGIKNCFIRLLNSKTVDVDKLDYITRDTQMSGFFNVPIDIERLTRSVTAMTIDTGWIYPAFRKNALSVIDNVFRAKSEQGLWMVSHPIVTYDSRLREICIKSLNKYINEEYITNVFSLESLSSEGIEFNNKKYRLLNDSDISSDLKIYYEKDELIRELYNRNNRRKPIWKSYFEYKHLFNQEGKYDDSQISMYFNPLINYMKNNDYFVLNSDLVKSILDSDNAQDEVKRIVRFIKKFSADNNIELNYVIISTSNSFGAKFDPKKVYIYFNNLPKRENRSYESYEFLRSGGASTAIGNENSQGKEFFYLFSKEKFTENQIEKLRDAVFEQLGREEIDRA
nr:HD domain-containing protein [Clostridium paraputrificum]